jgi:hypothetical protein
MKKFQAKLTVGNVETCLPFRQLVVLASAMHALSGPKIEVLRTKLDLMMRQVIAEKLEGQVQKNAAKVGLEALKSMEANVNVTHIISEVGLQNGTTRVIVVLKDGTKFVSTAVCSLEDQYDRKVGVGACLLRLCKDNPVFDIKMAATLGGRLLAKARGITITEMQETQMKKLKEREEVRAKVQAALKTVADTIAVPHGGEIVDAAPKAP